MSTNKLESRHRQLKRLKKDPELFHQCDLIILDKSNAGIVEGFSESEPTWIKFCLPQKLVIHQSA